VAAVRHVYMCFATSVMDPAAASVASICNDVTLHLGMIMSFGLEAVRVPVSSDLYTSHFHVVLQCTFS